MKADFHIHSSFSGDSDCPMEKMIEKGIALGLETMCFTEHMDFDYVTEKIDFEVDTMAYYDGVTRCREIYGRQIELLFGIELGLEPHLGTRLREYLAQWNFDFVIGSSHLVNGMDPYDPEFYAGRTEEGCYREYFETIPTNLAAFDDIDVYGHVDYVVRYGPAQNKYYSYERYRDVLDESLKSMITHGVGIELNTAGFKYGLGHSNPHPDVLRRYREFGGEIITVGSDGHATEHLAYAFDRVKEILSECGFRYYTIFRGRRAEFMKF